MKTSISAIICTHNPRRDYLQRVIDSLRMQSLTLDSWELILIDNASDRDLDTEFDLNWHPTARIIRENRLGLTAARLRGIAESKGEILIFVDDDNVLATDFLEVAARTAVQKPFLGCWGPGVIQPKYETPLPAEFVPYETWWCIRNIDRDAWANFDHERVIPVGAGLCIRRESAELSAAEIIQDRIALKLDRTGKSLASGGDIYLCLKCLEQGWTSGLFKALRLTHLIPPSRTTTAYVLGLAEGFSYSDVFMDRIFQRTRHRPGLPRRMLNSLRELTAKPLARQVAQARRRGERKALAELQTMALS